MSAGGRGSAPPTLVFAHGWGFDAGFWDALRARLQAWPQRALEFGYFSGSAGTMRCRMARWW